MRQADSIPQAEARSQCWRYRQHPTVGRQSPGQPNTIEAGDLTKRYGENLAVDDLTFEVMPGCVTGFLGPNGAGKSTTMRMIMGLDRPDGGSVTVNGHALPRPEMALATRLAHCWRREPSTRVAVLMPTCGCWPAPNQIPAPEGRRGARARRPGVRGSAARGSVLVGDEPATRHRHALLGDPGVLMFDEPVNGLDTDGIRWVRQLLRTLASEGRAVFVSSHLMSEMAVTADHVVVIGRADSSPRCPSANSRPRISQRLRSSSFARLGAATASSRSGGGIDNF